MVLCKFVDVSNDFFLPVPPVPQYPEVLPRRRVYEVPHAVIPGHQIRERNSCVCATLWYQRLTSAHTHAVIFGFHGYTHAVMFGFHGADLSLVNG